MAKFIPHIPDENTYAPISAVSIMDVDGTNEITPAKVVDMDNKIGILSNLNTTNKGDLVQAINENVTQLADKQTQINTLNTTKANQSDLNATNTNVSANTSAIATHTSQIQALASGSPANVFATLTALQSDTTANTTSGKTKTYVVTADGKWYYWNGTVWTPGGIYQSTGIANQSITPKLTTFATPTLVKTNIFDKTTVTDGRYINSDGVTTGALTNYAYSDYISVVPGESLDFADDTPSTFLMFYDINKTFISTLNGVGGTVGAPKPITVTVVANAYFIRFNFDKRVFTKDNYFVNAMRNSDTLLEMAGLKLKSDNLPNAIVSPDKTTFLQPNTIDINIFDKTTAVDGSYIDTTNGTTIVTLSNYGHSDYIGVNEGEVLSFSDNTPTAFISFYDTNKNYIGKIDGAGTTPSTPKPVNITVIANAKYLRFNYDIRVVTKDNYQVVAKRSDGNYKMNNIIVNNSNIVNELKGKLFTSFGDSITEYNQWQPSVTDYFALTSTNLGIGSTTVAYIADREATYPCFVNANRIQSIKNSNPDILTILGGTNDCHLAVPIGTDSEFTKLTANKDITNFKGAYSYLIETLLAWKPTLEIVIMTPMQSGFNNPYIDYRNAVLDIAENYALPIIDLYKESGLSKFNINTYTSDKLHPNSLGGKRIANMVIDKFIALKRV